MDPAKLNIDLDTSLHSNFDKIFAVDTNTRSLRGFRVSVTGVIEASLIGEGKPRAGNVAWGTPFCLEFLQVASKPEQPGWPEQLGWYHAALTIADDPRYLDFSRIALIVDSDLANLRAYNERSRPIFDDVYLPDRFTLVYASSDAGGEYLVNVLIRNADRASNVLLDALRSGNVPMNDKRVEGYTYAAFRLVVPQKASIA